MLWGLNWPIMKFAVGELSPWTFRSVCVVVSGARPDGAGGRVGRAAAPYRGATGVPLLVVAVFSVTGWHLFSAFSLVHMGGGRGAIVAYTMPIWAALFGAWYLGERLDRRRLAALALGMLGIAVLIGPDLIGISATTRSDRC